MSAPDALDALKARFRVRARTDRAALEDALGAGDRAALLTLAHGLSGVAGIFGHADVSARAARVEEAIDAALDDPALAGLTADLIAALDAVPQVD